MTEPEWLVRWRENRVIIDPDTVPMTHPPFGIKRITTEKLVSQQFPDTIFVFVGGPAIIRKIASRRLARIGAVTVTYRAALAEATHYEAEARKYTDETSIARAAWSILRAQIGIAVRGGQSVIVDAPISPYDRCAFVRFAFSTGVRAVIALDPDSMYEEELEEDGFTGAYWIQD